MKLSILDILRLQFENFTAPHPTLVIRSSINRFLVLSVKNVGIILMDQETFLGNIQIYRNRALQNKCYIDHPSS